MPAWLRFVLTVGIWMTGIGLLLGFFVAAYYYNAAAKFDIEEVGRLPSRTVILDRNDKELGSGGSGGRLVTRADLPDFMVKALQAREDKTFYTHSGVDVIGMARATVRNVIDRKFTQGASTLTMQLARNSYENMRAKSINRKLLEIALTLRIEHRYSKDEILSGYLNRIYFGAGCHGIEEASQTYFGKTTSKLHEGECAMLIGIIRGPVIFSPFRHLDKAREQQGQVLERMKTMNFITEADIPRIKALPIVLVADEKRQVERTYPLEAVRAELRDILDKLDIRNGGLVVKTSLDSAWQARLESDLAESLTRIEKDKTWDHPVYADHKDGENPTYVQCAAVTLETKTGAILAIIGGRDFADSRYDRTQGTPRDLGAAFEPWIAAAAAERGKLVLPGKPVLTGRQIGPDETIRLAKRCGLGGPFQATEDLFRGAAAATPMEVATGLATLGNKGARPAPYLIESVTGPDGEVLYTSEKISTQAIGKNAAREAAALLTTTAGTRVHGGATGSGRDAWLLRLGPKGSTAIWVGFDQPQKISTRAQLDTVMDDLGRRLGND
ncbi:MAG: penicillin-binding protein [Akkermansiaceae bacterium]|nr:penicillin-binding protein [Akkermansiaceae bacterium]